MNNPGDPSTPSVPDTRSRLQAAARVLRETNSIDSEVHRALSDLVNELDRASQTPTVPPAEVAHLADVTAHLTEALHHGHDRGVLEHVRARLQEMALQVETRAPTTVHVVERLINALANIGI